MCDCMRMCANTSLYIWNDSLLKALRFTQTACHLHIIWVHGGKRLIFRTWLLHPSYLKGFLWTSNRYPVSFHVLTQSHPTEGYDLMNSHQKAASIKSPRNKRWSDETESLKISSIYVVFTIWWFICAFFTIEIQHEIDISITIMIIIIIYVQLTSTHTHPICILKWHSNGPNGFRRIHNQLNVKQSRVNMRKSVDKFDNICYEYAWFSKCHQSYQLRLFYVRILMSSISNESFSILAQIQLQL